MPEKKRSGPRLAVGLISGTSMDGIDAALVEIRGVPEEPRVRLLAFLTLPYPWWLQKRLLGIAGGESTTAAELSRLNALLGELFGDAGARVCQQGRTSSRRLFVVGSHGQTIFHFGGLAQGKDERTAWGVDITCLPEFQGALNDSAPPNVSYVAKPSTLQIADSAVIAETLGAAVVADFRAADMAAAGQGAPLVPMVDYLLLRDKEQGTVALNIGGIANVTVIPANAKPEDVFGFDTGPGNMVIDGLVRHFTAGRKQFDDGGVLAAQGKLLEPVLAEALAFPFFNEAPPKSTGREQFGAQFVEQYFLSREEAGFEELVRTATELTAKSIADALDRFVFPRVRIHRLIVSGGGAHNRFLMKRLRELLPRLKVEPSDRYGLPVDAKEAIAFAVLADRTLHGLPGNLPSVTGARRAVVLGKIVRP